jgi:hypothetical protein
MSRLNRRTLIVNSANAAIALAVTGTASAREPQARNQIPSRELRALIKAHEAMYAAFGRAIHETGSNGRDCTKASRAEEKSAGGSLLLSRCRRSRSPGQGQVSFESRGAGRARPQRAYAGRSALDYVESEDLTV